MSDKHVYRAISAVTAEMAKAGIAKNRTNEQQGFRFRGIDDVYNSLASVLANNRLCMLPRVVERQAIERATRNGGVATYTIVTLEVDLVSAEDGSMHTIRTVGEAMDLGDKSSNKAMSAAFKYACFMAFQIPTEGDNDPDAHTIEKAHARKSNGDDWAEWEVAFAAEMNAAKTAGELKSVYLRAYREAQMRKAPQDVLDRLERAKDEAKSRFSAGAA
jgi:hypothetical protein